MNHIENFKNHLAVKYPVDCEITYSSEPPVKIKGACAHVVMNPETLKATVYVYPNQNKTLEKWLTVLAHEYKHILQLFKDNTFCWEKEGSAWSRMETDAEVFGYCVAKTYCRENNIQGDLPIR